MTDRTQTTKMIAAIHVGCEAADVHLRCTYPDCSCRIVPAAVKAAMEFCNQRCRESGEIVMTQTTRKQELR